MAHFAVGLERTLPINAVSVYDIRFGLERFKSAHRDVMIEVPSIPAGPEVKVQVIDSSGESVAFDGQTYIASALFPFIPPEYDITRIATKYLEIFVEGNRADAMTTSMHWRLKDMAERVSETTLGALTDAAKAMRWLLSGTAKLKIWIGEESHDLPIAVAPQVESDLVERLQALEQFGVVARSFGIELSDQATLSEDIVRQRQHISALASIAMGSNTHASAKFPSNAAPEGFDLGERCAVLFAVGLRTVRCLLVVATAIIGVVVEVTDEPGTRRIECDKLLQLSKRLVPIGTKVRTDQMYNEAAQLLNSMGITRVYRPAEK
jgi:hypothetical protein